MRLVETYCKGVVDLCVDTVPSVGPGVDALRGEGSRLTLDVGLFRK